MKQSLEKKSLFIGVKLEGASVSVFHYESIQEGIDHAHEIYEQGKRFNSDEDGFDIFTPAEKGNEMESVFSYEQNVLGNEDQD